MSTLIEDSDRHCPHDGKRMLVEIGQREEVTGSSFGIVEMVHICFNCGYRERDDQWRRPRIRVFAGPSMAERLYAQRMGVEVPLKYDTTPFPVGEFDEEPADA